MADDSTLKLLIQLGVIGKEDAEAAKQLLEETGKATEKAGKQTEDAGKEIEHFNTKGGDMKKLLHSLNDVLPGLGTALKVAFHPEALGLTGMLLALSALKGSMDAMKDFSAQLKEMGAAAGQPGEDILETMRQVQTEAATAQGKMQDWIKGLNDTFAAQDAKLKLTLSGIQQQEAATIKLIEAQTNLRKIQIENGPGTDEQKKIALLKLEAEATHAKAGVNAGSEQEQINLLQGARGAANANVFLAGQQLAKAEAADDKFGSVAKMAAAEEQAKKQLEDAKARLAKANEIISGVENPSMGTQAKWALVPGAAGWAANQATAATSDRSSATREIAQANAVLDQLNRRKIAEENASRAVDDARVQYGKAANAAKSLSAEIDALAQKIRIANATQPAIDRANDSTLKEQIRNARNRPGG